MKENIKHYPLRLPLEIHEQIKTQAQEEERSVNTMIIRLLRQALEGKYEIVSNFYAQNPNGQYSHTAD